MSDLSRSRADFEALRERARLGDAPVDEGVHTRMTVLSRYIKRWLNKHCRPKHHWGFVLLVFPFGHRGRCNYMSTAERPDVTRLMLDQAAAFLTDDGRVDLAMRLDEIRAELREQAE